MFGNDNYNLLAVSISEVLSRLMRSWKCREVIVLDQFEMGKASPLLALLLPFLFQLELSPVVIRGSSVDISHLGNYAKIWIVIANDQTKLIEMLAIYKDGYIKGSGRLWIFGVLYMHPDELDILASFLTEGDRIVLIFPDKTIEMNSTTDGCSVWSYYSPGLGNSYFARKGVYLSDENRLDIQLPLYYPVFNNFRGRTITVSTLENNPNTIAPKFPGDVWRGFSFSILNIIADKLNFKYTVEIPNPKSYGKKNADGKWDGIIGAVLNERADIAVGDISITPERKSVVQFTSPIYKEYISYIYLSPSAVKKTWVLFEPFTKMTWITFLIVCIFMTIIFTLFWKLSQNYRKDDTQDLWLVSVQIIRIFTKQDTTISPKTIWSRVLLLAWCLGSFVISSIYNCNLTSFKGFFRTENIAETLLEYLTYHSESRVAVRENSETYHYFANNIRFKKLFETNIQQNLLKNSNRSNLVNELLGNNFVFVSYLTYVNKLMYEGPRDVRDICKFYVSGEKLTSISWAMVLRKKSPFESQFNKLIESLSTYGILNFLRYQNWEMKTKKQCKPTDGINADGGLYPTTFEEVYVMFYFLIGGLTVSTVVFIAEFIYFYFEYFGCKSQSIGKQAIFTKNEKKRANRTFRRRRRRVQFVLRNIY